MEEPSDQVMNVEDFLPAAHPSGVDLVDPFFGSIRYLPRFGATAAHWVASMYLPTVLGSLTVRIDAAAAHPNECQRLFWSSFRERELFYLACALVVLKPAFNHYVGKQDTLRTMIDEFQVFELHIPACVDTSDTPAWHATYRSWTRPDLRFTVRFVDQVAQSVLVDFA